MDLIFDQRHIWHPYTSTLKPLPCYPVIGASGVYLKLDDGTELIDGMSSWWAAIHGYNHPALNQAAHQQIETMSHVMFGGLTHQPAIDLCKTLVDISPKGLEQVFLADSGSVAVEISLKMALQYWQARGGSRSKFLTIRNGYHGDTFAAMSVTDPTNSMHSLYKGFLPEHLFVDAPKTAFNEPWDEGDLNALKAMLNRHQSEIAAIILEPIVQGAGGMRFYHPNYLKGVRALCDEADILLIVDEIATGFGRTGKLFAVEHAHIAPDIMCVGKALTGGYMTLSAVLTSKSVADTICSGKAKCFMHGPTFMGNPLACAVANASLNLLASGQWMAQTKSIEQWFGQLLPPLKAHYRVKAVRWLGAIGVVETKQMVNMEKIQAQFVQSGVWIRPFGRLIYLMPPFISQAEHVHRLVDAIALALNKSECFIE